ncbi:arrestin domain-containing protein 2 isoform X2 [Tachysurus ichikawai]
MSCIRLFALELDCPGDPVYRSGEAVNGKVVLELHRQMDIRALKVQSSGVAFAHWLEQRGIGVNTLYNDYTSQITYFRKRQHLIVGEYL